MQRLKSVQLENEWYHTYKKPS
jgi:hypothetical protein